MRAAAKWRPFPLGRLLTTVMIALLLAAGLAAPVPAQAQATWDGIVPPGLSAGAQYRIIFVTSTDQTVTTRTSIADWNAAAQAVADTQTAFTTEQDVEFKILGSSGADNARDNTGTTGNGDGISIWWYNGDKVASSYADLYDNYWGGDRNAFAEDRTDSPTTEDGTALPTTVTEVLTGTRGSGDTHGSHYIGGAQEAHGNPHSLAYGKTLYDDRANRGTNNKIYALSEVLTVPTPDNEPSFSPTSVSYSGTGWKVGDTVSQTLPAATGGDGTLTYALTGGPVPGLTFTAATRVLAGTPTTAGGYTLTLTATDSDTSDPDSVDLTVNITIGKGTQSLSGGEETFDITFGDAAPTLPTITQTPATGGGTIEYDSSDDAVCTIDTDGGNLAIIAVGSCMITATITGNTNYDALTTAYTVATITVAAMMPKDTAPDFGSEDVDDQTTWTVGTAPSP